MFLEVCFGVTSINALILMILLVKIIKLFDKFVKAWRLNKLLKGFILSHMHVLTTKQMCAR